MGFIIGLIIGSALTGNAGSPGLPPSFGDIPFRCFAAIEQSDDAYKTCRRLSMSAQISAQFDASHESTKMLGDSTLKQTVDDALTFEAKALHDLETAAKARATAGH